MFKTAHPSYAELVIEVVITSLDLNHVKADIYAPAGTPEYWIVIPTEQTVEVHKTAR